MSTVRIIYTQKLKFLKYYVIHTLDFKKIATIQFSFKKGVYSSKKIFVSNFLFIVIDFLNLKVMLRNATIIFVLQYFESHDQIWE